MLWIIISTGIYKCCTDTKVFEKNNESESSEEDGEGEEEISKISKNEFDKEIRVLLKTDEFVGIYHKKLEISGENGLIVEAAGESTKFKPQQKYTLTNENLSKNVEVIIKGIDGGKIMCHSIKRSVPAEYKGELICYSEPEGIVVINQLPVEDYLCGVVPSEMPSSYPEEALKAQAISARTYTYYHMEKYAYPKWKAHVDDSTSYQVYKNISETEATTNAVNRTTDLVLKYKGQMIESFYYSTSGGYTGGAEVWGNAIEDDYLKATGCDVFEKNTIEGENLYREYIDNGNVDDIEYNEPWYRWDYEFKLENEKLQKFFEKIYNMSISNPGKIKIRSSTMKAEGLVNEKGITDIRVLEREKSGMVSSILIRTPNFMISIGTQHLIRQVLFSEGDVVSKKDNTKYTLSTILPSAFFYFDIVIKDEDNGNAESSELISGIHIKGAGMGHGAGLSQNGAKNLAHKGFTAEDILAYYYNAEVKNVCGNGD